MVSYSLEVRGEDGEPEVVRTDRCGSASEVMRRAGRLFDEMPRSNNIDVRLGGVKLCALERRNFAPPRQP
jgi:hypothetical protein